MRDPPVCPNCDETGERIPYAGPEFPWTCPGCGKKLDYCGMPDCENVIFQAEMCRDCAEETGSIFDVDPKTIQRATPDTIDKFGPSPHNRYLD